MPNCAHCQERLLDYAYGLLDETDARAVQEHLQACPACQAALTATQAEQKLLTRAARAVAIVPVLSLPTTQPVEVSSTAPTVPVMMPARPTKRPLWRQPWVLWGSAVAIFIAVGAVFASYQKERTVRQDALAAAKVDLKRVGEQIAALPARFEAEQKKKLSELRGQQTPYLHVVGPKSLPPHAKAPVHITMRGPDGGLTAGSVRIKLTEPKTGNVVHLARYDSDGQMRVDIDAGSAKPDSDLQMTVEADTPVGLARMQEAVRVQPASHVACLHTNKSIYHVKDVLFFRVLVLDRASLTPPEQTLRMRASLKNPQGWTVAHIDLQSGEGGIVAGELPIVEEWPAGAYTLEVAGLPPAQVPPVTQAIEIVRELPGIRLDQNRYRQGGVLTGNVTLPPELANAKSATAKIGNGNPVDVPLNRMAEAPQSARGGGFGAAKADRDANKGAANEFRFTVPIPSNLPADAKALPFSLELKDGKKTQQFRALVPLEPTEFTIDFFPEGGDLIAGVKNRVFYRIRSRAGDSVSDDGRVILMSSSNEIIDAHYKLGLGFLDFTPDLKATYTVRITTPTGKVAEIARPFDALGGVRAEGFVLHVPRAVGKEGDPIRVVVRRQGPARKLVLLAQCRGQIVEERTIEVKPGSNDVAMQPTADAHGMIRVTAYEVMGDHLLPVAERLIYRKPAQRLKLGFELQAQTLRPGMQNVRAKVTARDEAGQPAPAWVLGSIVDERYQSPSRSLSAHFLLLNEIKDGADLDSARLVLNDSPESTKMLERFLGTHGWRRFAPAREPSMVVMADAAPKAAAAVIFSRENAALERMQEKYLAARAAVIRPLRLELAHKEKELAEAQVSVAQAVQLAEHSLDEFEHETQVRVRLSLGLAMAGFLAASLILMGFAVYRLARHRPNATAAFGSAFACLAVCLGVVFVGKSLGELKQGMLTAPPMVQAPKGALDEVAKAEAKNARQERVRPLLGDFATQPTAKAEGQLVFAKKAAPTSNAMPLMMRGAPHEQAAQALGGMKRDGNLAVEQLRMAQAPGRFEDARRRAVVHPNFAPAGAGGMGVGSAIKPAAVDHKLKQAAKAKGGPLPPAAPALTEGARAVAARESVWRLEYAYQHVPNLRADTLYWHPSLKLDGNPADIRFDLPDNAAGYRVILLGHGPTGRFGFFETQLDVPAAGGR